MDLRFQMYGGEGIGHAGEIRVIGQLSGAGNTAADGVNTDIHRPVTIDDSVCKMTSPRQL